LVYSPTTADGVFNEGLKILTGEKFENGPGERLFI
jgi:hypothetical protein